MLPMLWARGSMKKCRKCNVMPFDVFLRVVIHRLAQSSAKCAPWLRVFSWRVGLCTPLAFTVSGLNVKPNVNPTDPLFQFTSQTRDLVQMAKVKIPEPTTKRQMTVRKRSKHFYVHFMCFMNRNSSHETKHVPPEPCDMDCTSQL